MQDVWTLRACCARSSENVHALKSCGWDVGESPGRTPGYLYLNHYQNDAIPTYARHGVFITTEQLREYLLVPKEAKSSFLADLLEKSE